MHQHNLHHDQPAGHGENGVESRIEFENERVRVVRFHFSPHARVPMHSAPDVVSIALTEGHLRLTLPDGRIQDFHYRPGDTTWLPAQQHAGENAADTPLEFVAVQLKG